MTCLSCTWWNDERERCQFPFDILDPAVSAPCELLDLDDEDGAE